jgi:hypothetical protein
MVTLLSFLLFKALAMALSIVSRVYIIGIGSSIECAAQVSALLSVGGLLPTENVEVLNFSLLKVLAVSVWCEVLTLVETVAPNALADAATSTLIPFD